jgi:oligosaccharide repeat unit polymerase
MNEFYVFFKFFKALGVPLPSKLEMADIIDRQSVYRTFWGEFYIDFGLFGILIMFFWGRFIKRIYIYAKRQHTQYVIFYSYLSTIIITSFFINFLLGSSSYYLFAFLSTLLIFKIWPENLKIVMK